MGVVSWSFLDLRDQGFTLWNALGWIGGISLGIMTLMIWIKMRNLIIGGENED